MGKKIILTVHGDSLSSQLKESSKIVKNLLLWSLKKLDKIICVNPKTKDELILLGINSNNILTLPAYINPVEDEDDYNNLPYEVKKFMNESKFLISANGCIRFYNNEDLYGLDMLIEMVKDIIGKGYDISLLFALLDKNSQNTEENEYYNELKDRIKNYGLEKKICIYEVNNTEFYPILKKSKLFIRPTNTDGYGVSIAEAIYYNVPSIASDVCNRPEGTILFSNRDQNKINNKVIDLINNYKDYKDELDKISVTDYIDDIIKEYNNMI